MFQAERTESTKAMVGMFKVKAGTMNGRRTVSKARVIDDETAKQRKALGTFMQVLESVLNSEVLP